MLLNNLKIAYRNLIRNKGYSFINISGLAIGMACTLLLLLWVNHELSYDKFHKKEKHLYQIVNWQSYGDKEYGWESISAKLIDVLKEKFPEIIRGTNYVSYTSNSLLRINDFKTYEKVKFADPDFFKMFSFPFIKGNADNAFQDPFSLVITEKMANKLFGEKDPMGEIVRYNDKYDLKITGVLKNLPSNTVFDFDFLAPFEFKKKLYEGWKYWGWHSYPGYVELDPNVKPEDISDKLNTFFLDNVDPESTERLSLFPLSKTHLYSLEGKETNIKTIRIFLLIALSVLLIACFNFMNLSTAKAAKRAKEIGVKKAIGSSRSKLIRQFLFESLLVSFIAINFALILVRLFIPEFNNILEQRLQFNYLDNYFIIILISIIIVTGLFAGVYPALYLTSYQTVQVMKGVTNSGKKGDLFRKILVILQFSLTTILLICTLTITLQTKFLKSRDIGIDKSNIVFLPINEAMKGKLESIKEELSTDPSILHSSCSSFLPFSIYSNGSGYEWNNDESTEDVLIHFMNCDADFLDVYGIQLKGGRFFSDTHFAADSNNIVINETFAKLISKESVVDQYINRHGSPVRIIGVVKDFNFKSPENPIQPMAFFTTDFYAHLSIKTVANSEARALNHIEKVCQKYCPEFPPVIHFAEDKYLSQYKEEESTIVILNYFSFLTILISCLGLFGLASFMAEDRTKEIGIRKVLGASNGYLVGLFSKEFTKWVILANVIAWPVAWFFTNRYLSNYAYRIDMPWWIYLSVGVMVLFIALLTVAYQSWKSATQNPILSLKYE